MFQRNFTVLSKVCKLPRYLYISKEVSCVYLTYFKFQMEILSFRISTLATSIHGVLRNGRRAFIRGHGWRGTIENATKDGTRTDRIRDV